MTHAQYLQLIDVIRKQAPLVDSDIHGEHHWRAVASTAIMMAHEVGGLDDVALLFGMLHDSKRVDDHGDPGHGSRAASYVMDLQWGGLLQLPRAKLELLIQACKTHTFAMPSPLQNRTVGICHDSDRVHLWRVGTEPDTQYLNFHRSWRTDWATMYADWESVQIPTWSELIGLVVTP